MEKLLTTNTQSSPLPEILNSNNSTASVLILMKYSVETGIKYLKTSFIEIMII